MKTEKRNFKITSKDRDRLLGIAESLACKMIEKSSTGGYRKSDEHNIAQESASLAMSIMVSVDNEIYAVEEIYNEN